MVEVLDCKKSESHDGIFKLTHQWNGVRVVDILVRSD